MGLEESWWLVSPGNPLKDREDMASLPARFRSALHQARCAPIRITAIEQELGTVFTIDTLRVLVRRYPRRSFVWLMGADNLAQFHRWKNWRAIARLMPIAVIARPGYDGIARASPARAWLRRYRISAASFRTRGEWSAPALIELRFDPDLRSATQLRRTDPDWAARLGDSLLRDQVTYAPLTISRGRAGRTAQGA